LINNLILTLFTIIFVGIGITYNRRNKSLLFICGLLLLSFYLIDINENLNLFKSPITTVEDFSGKSLTYVMKWASKNNIQVTQEYEYSDMVSEYNVISQDVTSGTNLSKVKEITISVSEGPNPSKEIVVPSMIGWDTDRVINYVEENYLSNVEVEFVESDKVENTVIEQSTSGNISRDDSLKLTFSYGDELGFEEVKLADFTGMSKFRIEFYMKQNQLNYEFDYDFSKKIKKDYGVSQSIVAGDTVKINDETIKVTLSKGPKIKVPDLLSYSITDITEWAIKNKVKLVFSDKYDDSVDEDEIISVSYDKGSIIEQGTTIDVVLSRGKLKMKKFDSLNDFYEWADKYEISYEEKHEFSDSVSQGEVISYSYKSGDTIKNNDTIIVTISDGKKCEVPNLKGLTKSEVISKLDKLGLNYSFVYKNSNDVSKDKVISQSISAGSEVSSNITITVTLSNGKSTSSSSSTSNKNSSSSSSSNKNSSSSSNNNSSNSSSNNNSSSNTTQQCNYVTVYIYDELISNVATTTCSKIKSRYSSLKFNCSYGPDSGYSTGMLKNSSSIDEKTFSTCEVITLNIVNND
jgi:beta-lactam-binding protein with PASTA domain